MNAPYRQGAGVDLPLDVERVRADFPVLAQEVNGRPLAYLDNAASAQRPQAVIDAIAHYYRHDHANVHRGVHTLSQRATEAYEHARERARAFAGAAEAAEIVFTRGTTEAINLVAQSWARPRLRPGDEVLITWMEHHSNIVPWQLVCEQTGARLRVAPVTDEGELEVEAFRRLLGPRTRVVAMTHVSNALGTINPVEALVADARSAGAVTVIDGAQAAPHLRMDVRAIGCDFYAFSSHKMYGPTGIGVLYGRRERLEAMPPWQGGGEMIRAVSFEGTTYAPPPARFEAGTPHIAGAVGLGAAIDYLERLGQERIARAEDELLAYATARVREIPGLRIVGTAAEKAAVLSFTLEGIHPHDVGTVLDTHGIAVRTGHHCAMPLMARYDLPATTRASFSFYNTRAEADRLVAALHAAREVLGRWT
jgi:cysteine desulfurase/selenocysteine lyase